MLSLPKCLLGKLVVGFFPSGKEFRVSFNLFHTLVGARHDNPQSQACVTADSSRLAVAFVNASSYILRQGAAGSCSQLLIEVGAGLVYVMRTVASINVGSDPRESLIRRDV